MDYQVLIADTALGDLREIVGFIAEDDGTLPGGSASDWWNAPRVLGRCPIGFRSTTGRAGFAKCRSLLT